MERTIAAAAARDDLHRILDDAEKGNVTLISRYSKPSAAVVPASEIHAFRLFRQAMLDVDETFEVSRDPEIVAAVKVAQEQIARGQVYWRERPASKRADGK